MDRNTGGTLAVRDVLADRADGQRRMKDALLLAQEVGESLDLARLRTDEDGLGAKVVVEVDVRGREDRVEVIVLELGKLVRKGPAVVVVEKGDRAQADLVGGPFLGDEFFAHHVPEELGSVAVLALSDEVFKGVMKGLLDREARADETVAGGALGHGASVGRSGERVK